MHTENDTQTVTNTLALYGVKRHTRAYYRLRSTVRFLAYTALVLAAFIGPHALVAALTA